MDKVCLDYDNGMVDQIYIDNEMHMIYHSQWSKNDRMEQYLHFQLLLYQLSVVFEVMEYYDDNLFLEEIILYMIIPF